MNVKLVLAFSLLKVRYLFALLVFTEIYRVRK